MISYQWDAQKRMIKLRDKLKQEGYDVWMDIEKMEGSILESMGKAVENADVILACISQKYQDSKSCKTEAEYAYTKNVPIIPLKIDDDFKPSSWLGPVIGASLYYRVDNDKMLNDSWPGILRAIQRFCKKTVVEETVKAANVEQLSAATGKSVKRRARKALDCSICLERFRNPKTLTCLHSFCKECLLGLAPYGTAVISCPLCRQESNVPEGDVNKLKSNFHLQELIEEEALQEQLTANESNKFTCTCCEGDEQTKAVGKCEECNHYLCSMSMEAHRKFPALRKHNILPFEEEKASESSSSSSPSTSTSSSVAKENPAELLTTVWEIFDALYNEDHSGTLIKYWMQRQGGNWQTAMVNQYVTCLNELEDDGVISEHALAKRQQQVARVFMQAGQYDAAVTLVKKTIELETKELGARPENLADLYGLASTINLEISKQADFIAEHDEKELALLREVIRNARKCIKLRKGLPGDAHKYKLGKTLVGLTFALSAWIEHGGDNVVSVAEAEVEAKRHIENAIEIFKELDTKGNLADAIMTKGILYDRGSEEQENLYMEAYKLCVEAYGECSVLTSRLNTNIGIMYEDRGDYHEAFKWFVKWGATCEKVFGYHHEKTEKTRRLFEEPKYAAIKKEQEKAK
ncbi:uncharacterized protein [Amphiura filiformis]|uniref:uncharacterized protein isoform X2 n=1 Tax=Amphiura filiformis TaxID=82378 RepID=UPI003B2132A6